MNRYIGRDALVYRRSPKKVNTDDNPVVETTSRNVFTAEIPDDVLIEASKINAVTARLNALITRIDESTNDMGIPVDDDIIKIAVKFLSNGRDEDIIRQDTWKKALDIKYSTPTLVKDIQKYDFMDALWIEIKIRICKWFKDNAIGKLYGISGWLDDEISKLEKKSMNAQMGMDEFGNPVTLNAMSKHTTKHTIMGLTHADNLINYVNKKSSEQKIVQYNTAAISLKPAVDTLKLNHDNTVKIIEESWGPFSFKKNENGFDISSPFISDNRSLEYIKDNPPLSSRIKNETLDATGYLLDKMNIALDQYFSDSGLACCLLENTLNLSRLADKDIYKLLKGLRLALVYTFNGLNLKMGGQFNLILDIINNIVSSVMEAMINTLQDALDGWLVNIRNQLTNYSKDKPSSWKRCYPFDEMMGVCLESLYDMENDLISYLNDFFNTIKLTHVNIDEYTVNIKRRELIRNITNVVDVLISGIETGALCKVDSITGNYMPLTADEIISLINDKNLRDGKTIDDLKTNAGISPSGNNINNLSERDRLLLQDCNKGFTENEIEEISGIINKMGRW
jgi:hypothetical protein